MNEINIYLSINKMTQTKQELGGFNIFKKSEQEKLELKNAKQTHKAELKRQKQNGSR